MSDIKLEEIKQAVEISKLDGFTGNYTELGGGGVNDTFLLDCGEQKVVLRVTRYHDVINLDKEAKTLELLDLPNIPKLLFHDDASRIMNRAWILETYVEGTTPVTLSTGQYANLGAPLANIHKIKHENQVGFDLWGDFLYAAKRFGDEERLLNHGDPRMKSIIGRAKPYLIEQTKRFSYVQESLVHGDATPGNILVKGDEVGLIDWEFSRFKDPMSDFSTAFYEDMEANRGKWRVQITQAQKDALYRGYEQAGGEIDEDRIEMWMNLDKLGLAVYLWWLINESGRDYPKEQIAQHQLDLDNLKDSLEKNLP